MKKIDDLDKNLIGLLIRDGRMPVAKIAKSLQITSPTVRARIQHLLSSGIIKIAALVNPSMTKNLTLAILGIRVVKHEELDKKNEQIANLDLVNWSAIVTGRYDIIAELILPDGMRDLYRFISVDMSGVGGIRSSESFMVIEPKGRWILLPQAEKTPGNWV